MHFIEGKFVYTVEITDSDVGKLKQILQYALRSRNKTIKINAQTFLNKLEGRGSNDGTSS